MTSAAEEIEGTQPREQLCSNGLWDHRGRQEEELGSNEKAQKESNLARADYVKEKTTWILQNSER